MALKEPYMQHLEQLDSAGEIGLKPDEDESYLIKSVQCEDMGLNEPFLELRIGRTTVGYAMVEQDKKNHIPYDLTQTLGDNLIEQLRAKGINVDYPIATGESFTVRNVLANKVVVIVYELYDAGDRKKDEVNGSEAKEYYQLNYGYIPAEEIKPGEYNLISASFLPKEMVQFPFGEDVPAKTEIDLIGLFGIPSYFGNKTDTAVYTKHLKLIRERTTLFTKQKDGFAFLCSTTSGSSVGFGYANSQIGFGHDTHLEDVFYPPKPITFTAGEELGIYLDVSTEQTATGIGADGKKIRVGVIERIRRL